MTTQPAPNPGYVINSFVHVSGGLVLLDAPTLPPLGINTSALHGPKQVAFSPDSRYICVADGFSGLAVIAR